MSRLFDITESLAVCVFRVLAIDKKTTGIFAILGKTDEKCIGKLLPFITGNNVIFVTSIKI